MPWSFHAITPWISASEANIQELYGLWYQIWLRLGTMTEHTWIVWTKYTTRTLSITGYGLSIPLDPALDLDPFSFFFSQVLQSVINVKKAHHFTKTSPRPEHAHHVLTTSSSGSPLLHQDHHPLSLSHQSTIPHHCFTTSTQGSSAPVITSPAHHFITPHHLYTGYTSHFPYVPPVEHSPPHHT